MKTKIFRVLGFVALAATMAFTAAAQTTAEQIEEWRKAAEQGNAWAQYDLGFAYENGEGVAEDKREAVRWYRKGAEQGHAIAQNNLGYAYSFGIAEDKREFLGYAYSFGKGVAEDKREAVRKIIWAMPTLLAKALPRISARRCAGMQAQYNLGIAYDFGKGVARDKREAVRWYRKATEQGDAGAQYNLGVSYWNGEGVITDEREAYIWFSIAKANGSETAADSLRKNNWRDYLSQTEIRSAQKEAVRRLGAVENRE